MTAVPRAWAAAVFLVTALHGQTGEHWVATWGTAQAQFRNAGRSGPVAAGRGTAPATPPPAPAKGPQRRFGIPPGLAGLNNQTVRMIARTSIGGRTLRIRLSNALGGTPVTIGAARLALRSKDSAIVPGSDRVVTFSGRASAVMYAGQTLVSDPVSLQLPPLSDVAVSLYFPGETGAPTSHTFGLHTTYLSKKGDTTAQAEMTEADATHQSYYWLAGLDVLAPADAGTLVTFGDSITDGDQSTPETNGMWPAVLAARLQANRATAHIGVVNAGISGNRVFGDNGSALARLYHDVLSQPGVKWMTLMEGINDITGASRQADGASTLTADDLIAAYRQIIETAHLYGVKAIGCTLTPFGGSNVYNQDGEAIRDAANRWIRTGGAFDAVIDFDAATRDASDPKRFSPLADSPDYLHPANPGYKMMADAVNLAIFSRRR
ncbi:MAG TPA: SGNH/GDSL hydrolase family protein [Candidatus Acidoferrales bacterium]|nr:SGNH/GDSL hydrolase family protein [Candidatus Acidoferrales bacterium]